MVDAAVAAVVGECHVGRPVVKVHAGRLCNIGAGLSAYLNMVLSEYSASTLLFHRQRRSKCSAAFRAPLLNKASQIITTLDTQSFAQTLLLVMPKK